ncbi:uncharacterized protein G2W53_006840 [Senna tora]|uniref:Uncharacterized protein n=1 Tax=Senna tora TaxID=362788 RepID=A0A834X4D0_9FABA|nr:uncharacterized protein G2W53_006840 [Senna tora]
MGNCQAIDAASIVIQHPNGKVERLYCPLTARQIMDANPSHYVALLVSTTLSPPVIHTSVSSSASHQNQNGHIHSKTTDTKDQNLPILHTRIKILKPTETLVLGQVYRLITAEEVMKGLWAKKQARMKNSVSDQSQKPPAKENLQLQSISEATS